MTAWLAWTFLFTVMAGAIGASCSLIANRRIGMFASGIVPWLVSLGWLGFREWRLPFEGSGVMLWLSAQLVWGTVASLAGLAGYFIARRMGKRNAGAF